LRRSVPPDGDQDADAGAPCNRVHPGKLAAPWRGSGGATEHLARRSVLFRDLVPRLGGVGGPAVDVADPRHLRSPSGSPAAGLVAWRRLEGGRTCDQRSRYAWEAAPAVLAATANIVALHSVPDSNGGQPDTRVLRSHAARGHAITAASARRRHCAPG